MLNNGNSTIAYNDFSEVPLIPYKTIEILLTLNDQNVEDLWKLLKYSDSDCLSKQNLTFEEKRKLIWNGDSEEQNYRIFLKPLIGSAIDTTDAQTQLRLYRYSTTPITRLESTILFELDILTNEKTSMVQKDGIVVERTDLIESIILNVLNGRDMAVGSSEFQFDKEFARGCQSSLNISNSKSFYGRSSLLALRFVNNSTGGGCK